MEKLGFGKSLVFVHFNLFILYLLVSEAFASITYANMCLQWDSKVENVK